VSRAVLLCVVGLAAAVAYPLLVPNYLVTIGMLVFFTAFIGQSWNIAGGFAGQTSFGDVVFFGTGAYTSTILQVTYGWNPWLAWPVAMAAGGAVGWMIAVLSFRAGLRGSYFALITLAFAEGFRILATAGTAAALRRRRLRQADRDLAGRVLLNAQALRAHEGVFVPAALDAGDDFAVAVGVHVVGLSSGGGIAKLTLVMLS